MKSYETMIREAEARWKEAANLAAADALYISEAYGKPLQTVCKAIAGDDWAALDSRCRRAKKTAALQPEQARRARDAEVKRIRVAHAKAALRDPDTAAALLRDPNIRAKAYQAADEIEAAEMRNHITTPPAGVVQDYPAKIVESLLTAQRAVARAAELTGRARLTEAHRDGFREIAARIRVGLEIIETARDLDDELRELLNEGV